VNATSVSFTPQCPAAPLLRAVLSLTNSSARPACTAVSTFFSFHPGFTRPQQGAPTSTTSISPPFSLFIPQVLPVLVTTLTATNQVEA